MVYVLDCSFCAALFLPDERSIEVEKTIETLGEDDEICIPELWWYEIASVLSAAVKRNRIGRSEAVDIIGLFKEYRFLTDQSHGDKYVERLVELALLHDLSAYDAAYLELTLRRNAVLGTLDWKLTRAAKKAGMNLLLA